MWSDERDLIMNLFMTMVKHIPKHVRVVEKKMDIFLCINLMMQMFMEAHGYGAVHVKNILTAGI